jgi:D-beta-D-heptose 7-phosphate kinase/D-beta-D-heptose 1-phosphate adenosyltransferase
MKIATKVVIATGGFDPVHSGHIAYFKHAAALGDILLVGLNSDAWLRRKKGRAFMPYTERAAVIGNLEVVYQVLELEDSCGTGADGIRQARLLYPDATIIFANGGDRGAGNVPEQEVFANDPNVKFEFGVGGDWKQNSSRWILDEWKAPRTEKPWGEYRLLHDYGPQAKLKELTVQPGQRLSMQRHEKRSEFWFVAHGQATVYTINPRTTDAELVGVFGKHQSVWINRGDWHQLVNDTDQPLQLVEIQYGEDCVEEDIERK